MEISGLRPAGGKRSSKRDRILNIFLRQKGHLSADDLCDLVRREDAKIGRATVYRTLQWMVSAGIANKVDFGEGRSRFEPAHHHPRHYHLVCTQCHRTSEFLSSDVEVLIAEIVEQRQFEPTETRIQIFGRCEDCRTGAHNVTLDGETTEQVFARDALRIAIATERSGREFYARAESLARDASARRIFKRLAEDEIDHLATLERRYQELLAQDPSLEDRPTFLFFKGAAHGIFAEGTAQLMESVDDRHALLVGIRCERDSHKFFRKYGERFEDSVGKKVFLEFAEEEREHRDMLIKEYRALRERLGLRKAARPARARSAN